MRIIPLTTLLMLTRTIAPRRRKKATNLSVDDSLLEQARRLKLNLSQVFEASLTEAIRQRQREEWLRKNRAALDAYNKHVEEHGVFSDGLRSF
ncbi:MAG: type II toxin-antitoxin system CcdA family antitoxin [Pseudomonadota bacterium]